MSFRPYPEYTPWTDKEISRFEKRVVMFNRRGMALDKAERLADRLTQRDQQKDMRRCCAECAHMQRDGACFAARQGWIGNAGRRLDCIPDLLFRCSQFEWLVPA